MVTQKAISLKIDFGTLDRLDKEVALGWRKRNNHINKAIDFYLDYKDALRRIKAYGSIEDKAAEYARFTKKYFPDMVNL